MNSTKPLEGQLPETELYGITYEERSYQDRRAEDRAEEHAQMRAPVECETSQDQRSRIQLLPST